MTEYPSFPCGIALTPSTLASLEADVVKAVDGWMVAAGELSNLRDENLWYRMACTGLLRMAERRALNAQERSFLARVKTGPSGPLRRWGDVEEENTMHEMER
jgi:uncharacterized protein YfaT (DUF1175 family)